MQNHCTCRGCAREHQPASSRYWGICVVLPLPVSPTMTTVAWFSTRYKISRLSSKTIRKLTKNASGIRDLKLLLSSRYQLAFRWQEPIQASTCVGRLGVFSSVLAERAFHFD